MPANKLTDKSLRNLKPQVGERVIGDGGGLWVRILPAAKGGSINFYYRFELNHKERRYNCGSYPTTTLAHARKQRDAARALVKQGIDPVEHDEAQQAAHLAALAVTKAQKTVRELFDDWERVHLSVNRNDGGKEIRRLFNNDIFPVIGDIQATSVRLPHIVQVVDRIRDRGARRRANQTLSLLRQMFRHGLARGIVDTEPTLGLSRQHAGGRETPRSRNLSKAEIEELAQKLPHSGLHDRLRAAIWVLLATGARVGELSKAQWTDIDLKKQVWLIPAANSKNGRQHEIHLSLLAQRQLRIISNYRSSVYVLSGRLPGTHIDEKTLSKAVRDRIRAVPLRQRSTKSNTLTLAGGGWTVHDLRRTFATRLGDLGIEPHIVERCLNHAQKGIVGVYQRQEYMKERKTAFDKIGRFLSNIERLAARAGQKPINSFCPT